MKDPNEFPTYNDPVPTDYEKGTYPPGAFERPAEPPAQSPVTRANPVSPLPAPDGSGWQNPGAEYTSGYAAPALAGGKPRVVGWYRAYAGFMAALYLLCIVGGILLLVYADFIAANSTDSSAIEFKVQGALLAAVGIVLFIAYTVALLLPPTSGAWVYHIAMIAIGLTSCCLWPATIPLIIAWIKPETQRYFGRSDGTPAPATRNPDLPTPPIPPA